MLTSILNEYIELFQDEAELAIAMYLNRDPTGLGAIDAFITCYYNDFSRSLVKKIRDYFSNKGLCYQDPRLKLDSNSC